MPELCSIGGFTFTSLTASCNPEVIKWDKLKICAGLADAAPPIPGLTHSLKECTLQCKLRVQHGPTDLWQRKTIRYLSGYNSVSKQYS